ncbi:peroxisome biogenesis factor 1 [Megalops cyprinoides]|uniref:peroxisome biogenesis factor 1 n=1 Tax=Megalops cyprinoides TaxID=118141 RepID=UPI001864F1A8|nr:peroxisome biogenesis factor 1 [Megalops cyprinoides]
MLGSHGIQPVTVVFNNYKNSFLHLSSNLISQLSLHENQVLELSWGVCAPVYLSWTRCRQTTHQEQNTVEVNRQLGDKLGIKDGEQGFLRPCHQVLSVQQVFVEPLSSDDWEILELHSSALEQQLLDQIRVVFPAGVFPVWVDQRTVIYVKIASLSPAVPYGRLEQFTELVVSPKVRQGEGNPVSAGSASPADVNQSPHLQRQQNFEIPPSRSSLGSDTLESPMNQSGLPGTWGGVTDLKSLLRYMFPGSFNPRPEVPSVPSIPRILGDSILRVCGAPPPLTGLRGATHGAVHVLPWSRSEGEGDAGGAAVTYGQLSRLCSARELRERAKRASEKKKAGGGTPADNAGPISDADREEPAVVVRVVCHCVEEVLEAQNGGRRGQLYSGRVWIPEVMRGWLNIDLRSAVRIQPLKSTPKLASVVQLQPLQPLSQSEKELDLQSSFFDWLHSQSNEALHRLTGRSSFILLPVCEENLEFALTVLKPESENTKSDDVFLLTTSLIQKTDIQIVWEPLTVPMKADDDNGYLSFPSLDCLGGVEDISRTAFEHISYCLMGGPLSQELAGMTPGLRNGALLITGPKGSGKTALSKALCRRAVHDLDVHVEVIECKKLRGKRVETIRHRLEEVFEQAVWRQPSVVFLDDLDHMTGAAVSPEHEHGPEALHCLQLAQSLRDLVDDLVVQGSLVALVVTSQSEHSLHPSLREVQGSHFFQCFVRIQAPDQVQRGEILKAVIRSKRVISADTLDGLQLENLARETEGYLPRDFTVLVERAIHANALHNRGSAPPEVCLSTCDFQNALKGFTPPSLWHAQLHTPSGAGLEKVGGLHEARQVLMDTILLPAKYPALFAKLPIRHRSGVLLYGAPGTGKTLLAGAVARESGMNFISIKGPELLSKYIGASEQAVRDVFQRAQSARPCILFFDEFDSLAPRRGHDSTGVTDRVVNQLLTQLDGVEGLQGVYVLAATSRPDLIDPALLRPGRLDVSLYCPPPDQEARLEILKALTHSVSLAGDVDLEQIASATDSFTGADLKALLYNAQLEAIHSSLGAGLLHDLGSGSDSDVSLSSMIFLNHSSGSDDSAGEGEGGPDHSTVLLDPGELPPEDPRPNIWRLYFGSSYESELGNASPSELNSQCLSGPNSMTHDLTGASLRDPGCSHTPVFMASLQEGFQELSHEQLERLRTDIANIKSNYRNRGTEDSLLMQAGPSKPALLICHAHLISSLASTRASISRQDWKKYTELYESFGYAGNGKSHSTATFKPGQRVTLA